jgi:hypothetical protein
VTGNDDISLKDHFIAAVLAWLVPGLGHIYQGRVAKGVFYFVLLMGAFTYGMYLGEWKVVYWSWDADRKPVVEGLCRLGMGLPSAPAIVQSFREKEGGLPVLGKFQAAPTKAELQELNARLNRTWHIAQIYTMIASLLNILVILDAHGGPAELAYARTRRPEQEPAPA